LAESEVQANGEIKTQLQNRIVLKFCLNELTDCWPKPLVLAPLLCGCVELSLI